MTDPVLRRPFGYDGIVATYGDPMRFLRADGSPTPSWERRILDTFELPRAIALAWDSARLVKRIRCHKLIAEPLLAAFRMVDDGGLWEELHDYGGCYNWRSMRGGSKLSTHCWGIAIDIDVTRNPLGAPSKMHIGVLAAFEAAGFYWGGRFTRTDAQHFQMAEGY